MFWVKIKDMELVPFLLKPGDHSLISMLINLSVKKAILFEINNVIFLPAPGPGNYRIPSDFGNYDHIDLYRTSGEFYSTKKSSLRPNSAIQSWIKMLWASTELKGNKAFKEYWGLKEIRIHKYILIKK